MLGLLVASGIVTYMFTSGDTIGNYPYSHERLSIKNAYVNGSTVFLGVQSFEGDIQLNLIIIKNASGDTIDTLSISDSILEGQSKTISANLNYTLASGNYTATLTTKVGSFVSPRFDIG